MICPSRSAAQGLWAKNINMADLTKLKPQERQILLIVGPSSVVWRLDDLSKELLDHGIRSLIDPVDLIDYFDKRPTLFTVVNNHVWSKIAPRKMPQNQVPQKLVKIPDEKENTIKTASHSNNDDATIGYYFISSTLSLKYLSFST